MERTDRTVLPSVKRRTLLLFGSEDRLFDEDRSKNDWFGKGLHEPEKGNDEQLAMHDGFYTDKRLPYTQRKKEEVLSDPTRDNPQIWVGSKRPNWAVVLGASSEPYSDTTDDGPRPEDIGMHEYTDTELRRTNPKRHDIRNDRTILPSGPANNVQNRTDYDNM